MIDKLPNFQSKLMYVAKMLGAESDMVMYIGPDKEMNRTEQVKFISKYISMLEETLTDEKRMPIKEKFIDATFTMENMIISAEKEGRIDCIKNFRRLVAETLYKHGLTPTNEYIGLKESKDEVERVLDCKNILSINGTYKHEYRWKEDVWIYKGLIIAKDLFKRNK